MKKILIVLLVILVFVSCNNNLQCEWKGYYRVRLTVTGNIDKADITIKYQDETSGYQVIELTDMALPFEYPFELYRGFGSKRVYAYISAKNNYEDGDELTDDGEVKTMLEYDIAKDGQYHILTRGNYSIEEGRAVCYAHLN